MRFEIRYNNQIYHLFDTHLYTAVAAHRDLKQVEVWLAQANK